MKHKEKFLALVSKEETKTMDRVEGRIARRGEMRKAFQTALLILERLDQLGWSQKHFAEEMAVSPQQVNKWVSGKENFTYETITKMEKVLDMELLQVPGLKKNSTPKVVYINQLDHPQTYANIAADSEVHYGKLSAQNIQPKIEYTLEKITTEQFALFSEQLNKKGEKSVSACIKFAVIPEKQCIVCGFNYQMDVKDTPLLVLQMACVFQLQPLSWKDMSDGNRLYINRDFAIHLAAITVGTARGVLHSKTENTPFNQYPMIMVNAEDMVEEDIQLELLFPFHK